MRLDRNRKIETTIWTLAICAAFIAIFYSDVVLHPRQVAFGVHGDALKNYFTPLYHIRRDPSFLRFSGLNYPYGDNVLYADAQPLLSNLIKFLAKRRSDLGGWDLAALNLAPFLSLVVACWILGLIMERLGLPSWYSAVGAVAIAFVSPQVYRIPGHYSLAYVAVIPLIWYLLIIFFDSPDWRLSALIGAVIALAAGLHLYYLMLGGALVAFYWLAAYVLRRPRSRPKDISILAHLALQIGLPFAALAGFLFRTDPDLSDRASPSVWRVYLAEPLGVFLPSYPPYLGHGLLPRLEQPEGIAYVTALGVAVAIGSLAWLLTQLARRRRWEMLPEDTPDILKISLLCAALALLLSFGLPLRWWDALEPLAYPFRQFRVVGRMAWIFYYLFMVVSWYVLYRFYLAVSAGASRAVGALVLAAGIGLLAAETVNFNLFISSLIDNRAPVFTDKADSDVTEWIGKVDVRQYQAIVPLPYYHLGSETYFDYWGSDPSIFNSMVASLRTGAPLVSSFMNRTPLTQTRRTLGFIKGGPERRNFVADLPSRKPLLLLVSEGDLKVEEERLIRAGTELFHNRAVRVYRLDLSRLSGGS